jgi:nucleoside-diphosphate-sugar epimerase
MIVNREKILVTGAGGFIGWHLCKYLAEKGHPVVGVDLRYPEESNIGHDERFRPVSGDFRNKDLMDKELQGIKTVVHLASAHLKISLHESEYWDINVHSLRPLLNAAQRSAVQRFIHVSSVGAYGNPEVLPANEETPCNPQNIYGKTKIAGEAEVRRFSKETGFPIVIIRPAWVYGPGCPRTLKLYKALREGKFIMIGKGMNLRHPIYISDMLDAFDLAIHEEAALGELFVIGGERAIMTHELVDTACKVLQLCKPKKHIPYWLGMILAWCVEFSFGLLKKEPPISRRSLEFFNTNNSFDICKAKTTLGFQPKYSFEDGLRDTRTWLMAHALKNI